MFNLSCYSLEMESKEGTSEVRVGAVEARSSDLAPTQEIGRQNYVFPPPEVKFDGGNMFEWSKMVTLTLYGGCWEIT